MTDKSRKWLLALILVMAVGCDAQAQIEEPLRLSTGYRAFVTFSLDTGDLRIKDACGHDVMTIDQEKRRIIMPSQAKVHDALRAAMKHHAMTRDYIGLGMLPELATVIADDIANDCRGKK